MRLAVIVLTLMMTFFNGYLYLYILQRENYRADGVLNRSQKLIVFDLIAFLLSFASLLVAWTVFGNSNWKGLFY
ncbi:MAG: hypothetical protein EOM87_03020, partial [Clostridia bacterium]|nr:hypothetical protein [Clostridia bacterium]